LKWPDVFEVPLAFLMNPAHHRRHIVFAFEGGQRQFLSMPWQGKGARRTAQGVLHLGRHGGDVAQPLPAVVAVTLLGAAVGAAGVCPYHQAR
jgi:hypothetical protein